MVEDKDLDELKSPNKSKENELVPHYISYDARKKKMGSQGSPNISSRIGLSPAITSMGIGSEVLHFTAYNRSMGLICPISGTTLFNPEKQTAVVTILDNETGQTIREVVYTTENFVTSAPAKEKTQKEINLSGDESHLN
jgi:hypothetical protein